MRTKWRSVVNVLVIYHSRSGHTRDAAEAIATAAREMSYEVTVRSVAELRQADVEKAHALFIGTWVHGMILFGVRPAGVEQWVPALPSLTGKPVGIFCTYAFNPRGSLRMLGAMLQARGATVQGQRAFHRSHPGEGADSFVQSVMQSVN
jgi:flavodoxin